MRKSKTFHGDDIIIDVPAQNIKITDKRETSRSTAWTKSDTKPVWRKIDAISSKFIPSVGLGPEDSTTSITV